MRGAIWIVVGALALAACSRRGAEPTEASPRVLVGAGATLPYPLYSKWAAEYARVEPTVRINYQSVGSGAGVRQVSDGVVDFGATDEPLSGAALAKPTPKLVQIPTTVGAVVLAYNLPGTSDLALTPELIADIFLGRITRWDDTRLRATNPAAAFPNESIAVVHRADGSGTSAALTTFLSRKSSAWSSIVGEGSSARFPVGVGAKGNEGVTAFVKTTPFTIGYVELAYAKHANVPMARVENRSGKFISPTVDAIERASRSTAYEVAAAKTFLFDAEDERAYPIAAVSFVLLHRDAPDVARAEAMVKFLWWAVHDGQKLAPALDYAPLPPALVARAEDALRGLQVAGRPLLPAGG